jgi:hypothetical protein
MIHQLWIVWYPIVGIVWSLSKVTLLLNGEEHDINGSQLQELGDGHLYFPLEFTNTILYMVISLNHQANSHLNLLMWLNQVI